MIYDLLKLIFIISLIFYLFILWQDSAFVHCMKKYLFFLLFFLILKQTEAWINGKKPGLTHEGKLCEPESMWSI